MKVYMDRNLCSRWQAGCDSCFGTRVERGEFILDGCVLEVLEDDCDDFTLYIKDRDGTDKTLIVNEENWPEAYDSWQQLWEKQQAGENHTILS